MKGNCILDWSCCFIPKKEKEEARNSCFNCIGGVCSKCKNGAHQKVNCDKCGNLVPATELEYSQKTLTEKWRRNITTIPELNDLKKSNFCLECQKEIKNELKKINRR